MTHEVVVQTLPEQIIAAVRQRTTRATVSEEIRPLLDHAWELIRSRPDLQMRGRNVALYHPDGSVEVGVEVPVRFGDEPAVVCAALPGGTVATCAYFGPYSGLGEAYDAMRAWAATTGSALGGTFWELYGHWTDDASQLRTDVCYLLQ